MLGGVTVSIPERSSTETANSAWLVTRVSGKTKESVRLPGNGDTRIVFSEENCMPS